MNLVTGFTAMERQYGYMSDEAITWFRKQLAKIQDDGNTDFNSRGVKITAVEKMSLSIQRDIIEMYQLGYSSNEIANYFDLTENKVRSYFVKLFRTGAVERVPVKKRNIQHNALLKQVDRGKYNNAKLIIAHGRRKA